MKRHERGRHAFRLALLLTAAVLIGLPAAGWSAYSVNEQPFYTQPYLVSPKPHNSMYVCWLTSEKTSESYVEFGLDESYGERAHAQTHEIREFKTTDSAGVYNTALPVYQQVVHLKGLKPGNQEIDNQNLLRGPVENGRDQMRGLLTRREKLHVKLLASAFD